MGTQVSASNSKMAAARRLLDQRLNQFERAARRGAAEKQHPACVVRGDAISFGCELVDLQGLRAHPDFHCFSAGWLGRKKPTDFLPYGRISRFENKQTGAKFWVYASPQMRHLPKFRISYFPDDGLGLQPQEILSVLQFTEQSRIVRMEIAFDFGAVTGIKASDVRRSFVSGKCQAHSVREKTEDQWGCRNGSKFIRSYFKRQIGAHRVELQLNGRFLRGKKNQIDDVFQFHRFPQLLPGSHFYFAKIDQQKLIHHLRTRGFEVKRIFRILKNVVAREEDLCSALNYLRRSVGLTNVNRLMGPLPANQLAQMALADWAARWPKRPAGLVNPK